jgi:hypothetical protein
MEVRRPGNTAQRNTGSTGVTIKRRMSSDETNTDVPVANDSAIVSSVLVERSDTPKAYLWRLSGNDLQIHAFRVDGGYVVPRAALSIFENRTTQNAEFESFGPYEVWVAECGHMLPVAMVLPHSEDRICVGCRVTVKSSPLQPPPGRDWPMDEALQRRRNAGASGALSPVAEVML